jgi:hypothetical protein
MSTASNTLSYPPLPYDINKHVAFLQRSIINILNEQSEMRAAIGRLEEDIAYLRWDTRSKVNALTERINSPYGYYGHGNHGDFTPLRGIVSEEGIKSKLESPSEVGLASEEGFESEMEYQSEGGTREVGS